jgi:hypothetical protein
VTCMRWKSVLTLCLLAEVTLTPILHSRDAIKPGILQSRSFQNGVEDYKGTVDAEIWALAPTTFLSDNPNASSDADNDGGESQVLIRFDHLIGDDPNQGSTVNLHRMLVPFSESATWNSMVDGVSADGFEASRHKDSFTFGKIAANTSLIVFDVTDTVQAWASGQNNHGWVFINTGGNGWDFYASEFDDVHQRPKLIVEFETSSAQQTPAVASK